MLTDDYFVLSQSTCLTDRQKVNSKSVLLT